MGRAVLEVLEDHELGLGVESLSPLASGRGAGGTVPFRGDDLRVEPVRAGAFRGVDLALLAVPADVARAWAPAARGEGALVVDASEAFRADPEVPLVVPEVNPEAAASLPRGIAASPCGLSVALPLVLRPLREAAGLARVAVVGLESVSGAGRGGVEQLEREAHALMNGREPEAPGPVPHRVAFNLVPATPGDGQAAEVRRVLAEPALPISTSSVRVPVFYGHAAQLTVVTRRRLPLAEAREALRGGDGLKLVDVERGAEGVYPMPMLAVNDDAVHVGRLREDPSQENGLELLLAVDNLRKGGATNLVQVAALVAARHLRPA